ncbi:hypothetical protein BDV11DRAFT_170590 [Aspergillus similis]
MGNPDASGSIPVEPTIAGATSFTLRVELDVVFVTERLGSLQGGSWYASAKAAIAGYSRNLAVELKGHTRVNTVAPGGPVRTPRNTAFIDKGVFSKILDRNPTGQPGAPEELANGIIYLLSPAASYINGHMLCIDGGLSIAE